MSDDLIKRLEEEIRSIMEPAGDPNEEPLTLYGEAAAALSEAQATIARQQVMLDRALESGGAMMVENARLREALRQCPPTSNPSLSAEEHVERINVWWRLWARPALSPVAPDQGEG